MRDKLSNKEIGQIVSEADKGQTPPTKTDASPLVNPHLENSYIKRYRPFRPTSLFVQVYKRIIQKYF